MSEKPVLQMIRTDLSPEMLKREIEWNNWYNNKHIPERINNVPGFFAARRFVRIEGEEGVGGEPKYLSLYNIASVDVLTSDAYLRLRDKEALLPWDSLEAITPKLPNFHRGLYEQIYPKEGEYRIPNTEILYLLAHDVPAARDEEYNIWYDTEHIPLLMSVPGFINAQRFKALDIQLSLRAGSRLSTSPKYLTIYGIESRTALHSDAYLKVRDGTPWHRWVRSWFIRRLRFVGQSIFTLSNDSQG